MEWASASVADEDCEEGSVLQRTAAGWQCATVQTVLGDLVYHTAVTDYAYSTTAYCDEGDMVLSGFCAAQDDSSGTAEVVGAPRSFRISGGWSWSEIANCEFCDLPLADVMSPDPDMRAGYTCTAERNGLVSAFAICIRLPEPAFVVPAPEVSEYCTASSWLDCP